MVLQPYSCAIGCNDILLWLSDSFMYCQPGLWSRSRKELEVFGWNRSRIPNNTGSRSWRFLGGAGVGFLTTLAVGVGFFVRLQMSNWTFFTSHF